MMSEQNRSAVFAEQRRLWVEQDKQGPVVESRSRKPWSEDESDLVELWNEDPELDVIEIAEKLGRTKASVSLHIGRNRERLGLALRPKGGKVRRRGTFKRLAELLEIRQQLVTDYAKERPGTAQPPVELLERMNDILGLTMSDNSRATILRRKDNRQKVATIPHVST